MTPADGSENGRSAQDPLLMSGTVPDNGNSPEMRNAALLHRRRGVSGMGDTGFEPVTPSLSSWCSPN